MMKIYFKLLFILMTFSAIASETSVYDFSWLDKDKEVYVLQNRKFRKDGRLYVGVNGIKTISGAFIDAYGASARVGYFFQEDWGVEFLYSKYTGDENSTASAIRAQGVRPFYRKIDNMMGGILWWSPFYAKINTFNSIFYYDWMFGLGVAQGQTQDNRNLFSPGSPSTLTTEGVTGGLWATSMRFHLNQAWSVRLDFTGFHYSGTKFIDVGSSKSELFSNYDFSIGLAFAF